MALVRVRPLLKNILLTFRGAVAHGVGLNTLIVYYSGTSVAWNRFTYCRYIQCQPFHLSSTFVSKQYGMDSRLLTAPGPGSNYQNLARG